MDGIAVRTLPEREADATNAQSTGHPLSGESIVCFAGEDWWYHHPHSKNHILKRLARHNRVLFVNSITMGLPSIGNADFLQKVRRKLRSYLRWLRKSPEGLWVMTPLNVPLYGSRVARALNRLVLILQLRLVMLVLRLRHPIIWAAIPTAADIVEALGGKLLVYQVSDKYDRQEDSALSSRVIREMDGRLKKVASVVMYSGRKLYEESEVPHRYFLEQAVDFERFAHLPSGTPADIANIPRPVLGYVGAADWYTLDVALIEQVARQRPDWHWVFIGARSNVFRLSGPNIHFLGPKPYSELPRYYSHIDVCVLPWNQQNVFTSYGSAIKVREYLATGKPVVISPLYEYLRTPGLRIYRTTEEFIAHVSEALSSDRPSDRQIRQDAVRDCTWDARAKEVAELLRRHLDIWESSRGTFASIGGKRLQLRLSKLMDQAVCYHSSVASTWEQGYRTEVFSVRKAVLLELLAGYDLTGLKWLDVGCGTGTLARFLAERKHCQVLGLDASEEMIRHCSKTANTDYARIDDICETQLPDEAFDGAVCSSVVEYVAQPSAALGELRRVLKENGFLLISAPNSHPLARWPVVILYWLTKPLGRRRMFEFLDHSRHAWSEAGFFRLLERSGFRPEAARTFGGLHGFPIFGQGTLRMVRARKVGNYAEEDC